MAKVEMKMPDDFLQKISRLGEKADTMVPKALEAGGEVMLAAIKNNLQSVVGKNTKDDSRSTGELADSLGISEVKQDRNGNHNIKVGFAEPRQSGESNAKIATILEYGKHNQSGRPFLKPAKSSARSACMNAMKTKLEEEIGSI